MTNYYYKTTKILSFTICSMFMMNLVLADPVDGCELGNNQLFLTAKLLLIYAANFSKASLLSILCNGIPIGVWRSLNKDKK